MTTPTEPTNAPVIAIAGRRIDAANAEPRFPAQNEQLVRERVRSALERAKPRAIVCAAACGADLIALDEAGKLGIRRRVVLPNSKSMFRERSVVDRPGDWGPLFDRVVAEVEAKQDLLEHNLGSSDADFKLANTKIFEEAATLHPDAPLQAWLIWNGAARGSNDISLHFADEAWARGIQPRELLTVAVPGRPAGKPERMCFVAMPFRVKLIDTRAIDFDAIYSTIIAPAIESVELPEGGCLQAYRTDKDPTTGVIDDAMHRALTTSRIVVADITGQNANVTYELGIRHAVRMSGTAVFRQAGTALPFDISHVKVFDYDTKKPSEARAVIATVVHESIAQNPIDSPVRQVLQRLRPPQIEALLKDAENALRHLDVAAARSKYKEALKAEPEDALINTRLAVLENRQGRWSEGLKYASEATRAVPEYSDAWRERGVAENQLWRKQGGPVDGVASLRRAIELNDSDFDALASLGGALWRTQHWDEALSYYKRSLEVSSSHPYPLLMALKLEARVKGQFDLTRHKSALRRAALIREQHTRADPPYDLPWSYFDLIEIYLYLGRRAEALKVLRTALDFASSIDQIKSFRGALDLLNQSNVTIDGLAEILAETDAELAARTAAAG